MKPSVPEDGRKLRRGLLVALLLCAGCGGLEERPGNGERCNASEGAIAALPLSVYSISLQTDAGARPIALIHPSQVASRADEIFVADEGLRQLVRIQRSTQKFRLLAPLAGRVSGMHLDAFRSIYLALPGASAILQLSAEGTTERVIRDAASMASPVDVTVDRESRIIAADGSEARVLLFDRLGTLVGALGERIDGPNPFATTQAVAANAHSLYVLDRVARKIHRFERAQRVGVSDLAAIVRAPSALAIDRLGRPLVLDHGPERVLLLQDPEKARWVEISGLDLHAPVADLWVNEFDELFIAEPGAVRVFALPRSCAP